MKKWSLLVILMILVFSLSAETYFIPVDFATIQDGIDASSNGDSLIIDEGVYYETIDFCSKSITVGSRFCTTGDSSYISTTIIDGNGAGSVVSIFDCEGGMQALCGLTIQHGMSNYGGGIHCINASPVLMNLIISDNEATGSAAWDAGGGLYMINSYSQLIDVDVIDNFGEHSGGMKCIDCDLDISGCSFLRNESTSNGGGIEAVDSDLDISNSIFADNYAEDGGGIHTNSCTIHISSSQIRGNTAIRSGGGIKSTDGSLWFYDNYQRCSIYLNNVNNRYGGSEIYSSDAVTVFVDTFTVVEPTSFHCHPLENFVLNIVEGIYPQVENDLYVSPEGDNDNSGESFEEALRTIQHACNIITASDENPLTIYLAAGEYSLTINGEFFPVILPPNVSLIGAGQELTCLNAEGNASVLKVLNSENAAICNLTVKFGYDWHYGGILCDNSQVDIYNVKVEECNAYGGIGGGISLRDGDYNLNRIISENNMAGSAAGMLICGSTVLIDSAMIKNNIARETAGAIGGSDSQITVKHSEIYGNCAETNGGAISLDMDIIMSLEHVKIHDNVVYQGNAGGIYTGGQSELTLTDVQITRNICSGVGGGLFCSSNSLVEFSQEDLSSIYLNNAELRRPGADIYSTALMEVIVDTFTVAQPTDYHAEPVENFSFFILNSLQEQIEADIYVSPDGDNNNSGLSADQPLQTIQCACSRIIASEENERTIYLLPGTYSPSVNGEFMPITLPDNVSLCGTEAGSAILDGDQLHKVLKFERTVNNSVSNLKVVNGYGIDGAGIYIKYASPVIENVTLQHNQGTHGLGGAIFIGSESSPILNNLRIEENSSAHGAGIFIQDATVELHKIIVENNTASREGGGIKCRDATVLLDSCVINSNWAADNGGGILLEGCDLQMYRCLIADNISLEPGGGMQVEGNSVAMINNTTIANNSGSAGSGIYVCDYVDMYLMNCILWGNFEEEINFNGYNYNDILIAAYCTIDDGEDGILTSSAVTSSFFYLLDEDPCFTAPQNEDYTLLAISPCIDSGIDYFSFNGITAIDLDEDEYDGSAPDRGYFEYIHLSDLVDHDVDEAVAVKIYPNPFNPSTMINYYLPADSRVVISVYNIKGQLVDVLLSSDCPQGHHQLEWQPQNLSSGVYNIMIQSDEVIHCHKLLLIK